jgi:hypothetical protein
MLTMYAVGQFCSKQCPELLRTLKAHARCDVLFLQHGLHPCQWPVLGLEGAPQGHLLLSSTARTSQYECRQMLPTSTCSIATLTGH